MENNTEQEKINIIIDGNTVSLEEYQAVLRDPKIMLKEISKNNYKTLQRLYG